MLYWKSILTIWQKYEGKGTSKIPIFKHFSELGKLVVQAWDFQKSRSWIGKNLEVHVYLGGVYTQPKTNILRSKFWIYGWMGKNMS